MDEILKKLESGLSFTPQGLELLASGLASISPSFWPVETSSAHFPHSSSRFPFPKFQVCFSSHNFNSQEPFLISDCSFLYQLFLINGYSVFCYFSKDINDNFLRLCFVFCLVSIYLIWSFSLLLSFHSSPHFSFFWLSLSYWKISWSAWEIFVYSC